jgi:hypothetical protein
MSLTGIFGRLRAPHAGGNDIVFYVVANRALRRLRHPRLFSFLR